MRVDIGSCPIVFEFNSLYSSNSAHRDSLPALWPAIFDFVYFLVLCICGKDRGTSEEFEAIKSIISRGEGLSDKG